eukprot:m.75492 g.75492  ORF g.75492 m.75492 type:complete len:1176 (-) comp20522_c0_seq1:32-3559(-)
MSRLLELDDFTAGESTTEDESVPLRGDHDNSFRVETNIIGNADSDSDQDDDPPDANDDDSRTVLINNFEGNSAQAFLHNRISTTKYNVLTFLPKFLFEQFSRYANLFFLFTAIVQQFPGVSPTGRYTTIGPLSVVLAATAIKELAEDWKRMQADTEVNHRRVKVFREGTFVTLRWTEIQVGDLVKVLNNQFFPADLVLLSSSEPQGMCYVETANLDGETNLKIRQALPQTSSLTTTRDVRFCSGHIECEGPNNRLYKFIGNVKLNQGNSLPLGPDQLLLRGAQLRNTPWVYGVVVYTGHESKLMQNASAAPIKRSNVDDVTNKQIILLFFVLLALCCFSTIANAVWLGDHESADWYLGYENGSEPQNPILTFFTFVILYNNLIPISLIITLELVKFVQALVFINNDLDMYDPETDTPAQARTSTLNEELGQVQYIFSDKTGTLTRNKMQFLKCTIGGIKYGDVVEQPIEPNAPTGFHDPHLLENLTSGHQTASVIREWLTLLATCHTVVPERDRENPDKIIYQAASPDEHALVTAVKHLGFSFNTRTPESVTISALGQDERYEILNVLEFNSTRKRMSVIVRCPNGQIKLYCKGADSVIYERLAPNQPFADATLGHLKDFASDGLRTLCLAVAQLDDETYTQWNNRYKEACTALVDRADKMDAAAALIEKDLFLLGATAIEDRLQDGVPETIRHLAQAGIKIWVLTGDKQETAINIGFSCKLLLPSMKLLICNEDTHAATEQYITRTKSELDFDSTDPERLALIIDGHTLAFALSDELAPSWLALAKRCKAVVCCRVSPKQKADVVRLVKNSDKAITLAIGDGANDVSMIQAAHVGVGISGQEGLQAARASDYSFSQFRFLKKLLLVHGHWSYTRVTSVILYSFYKNIALYLIQFWFAMVNGFSGQILFERWNIAAFNVFFTLLQPLAIGIFDQPVSAESLMTIPQLYKSCQRGDAFNTRVFWGWAVNSIAHSILLFWLPYAGMSHNVVHATGLNVGMWFVGESIYSLVVFTVILKAALIMKYWTIWNHISLWGSMLIWIIFSVIYFNLWYSMALGGIGYEVYGLAQQIYSSGAYWFSIFLVCTLVLTPDFMYETVQKLFFPTPADVVRERESKAQTVLPPLEVPTDGDEWVVVDHEEALPHYGYAFSQNESNATVTQAEVIRRYDTNMDKPLGD